eukprot:TRINITY_DN2685_c0_g1_i10.p1 TRINITY_DN2685_c0_g1~~TRINITY_DN2685_c0_g1_i10.p1  ORF type:complete len:512 (+),score=133.08 TRINITY_DN2685_c0_g1_i10:329-1864(+)
MRCPMTLSQIQTISRTHAYLQIEDGDWVIRDNNSINGIFVNNIKVMSAKLRDSDVIVFGYGGDIELGGSLPGSFAPDLHFEFHLGSLRVPKRKREQFEEETESDRQSMENSEGFSLKEKQEMEEKLKNYQQESIQLKHEMEEKFKHYQQETIQLKLQLAKMEKLSETHKELELVIQNLRKDLEIKENSLQIKTTEFNQLLEEYNRGGEENNELHLMLEEHRIEIKAWIDKCEAQRKEYATLVDTYNHTIAQNLSKIGSLEKELYQKSQILAELEKNHMQELSEAKGIIAMKEQELKQQEQTLEETYQLKIVDMCKEISYLKGNISPNHLMDELTCSICQDLYLHSTTLPCSHTFCYTCISSWIKQNPICPICRVHPNHPGIKSLILDSIIEKFISNRPEDNKRYLMRKADLDQVENLRKGIESAKKRGYRFLRIQDVWNETEKQIFAQGVEKYTGESRIIYCSAANLSETFISTSSIETLHIACANLNLRVPIGAPIDVLRSAIRKVLWSK